MDLVPKTQFLINNIVFFNIMVMRTLKNSLLGLILLISVRKHSMDYLVVQFKDFNFE